MTGRRASLASVSSETERAPDPAADAGSGGEVPSRHGASATFAVLTPVGPIGRWLPSLDAAWERFLESVREELEGGSATLAALEWSTEGEQGEVVPQYARCSVEGQWRASIVIEIPIWPSLDVEHGPSPELAMVTGGCCPCASPRLLCRDEPVLVEDGRRTIPAIECASCGCRWSPEGARVDWERRG